jgi:hypothetical protein
MEKGFEIVEKNRFLVFFKFLGVQAANFMKGMDWIQSDSLTHTVRQCDWIQSDRTPNDWESES